MRRTLATLVALIVVVLLAACGTKTITLTHTTVEHLAGPTTTATSPTPLAGVPAPTCSPADETMSCVLARVGAPPELFSLVPGQTYGVDFGWGGVSAAGAAAVHARFGASYFSNDTSKNWTKLLVDAYHAAGLKTVGVWESTATRSEEGYTAGVTDAQRARTLAAAVGNTTRPILFAVDCDCAGAAILSYFQGVHSVLGGRGDAYGGYDQVLYLYQHGVVGHENWQTYAWSGGRWLPATIAPLEQYLNGSIFDNDRAIAPAYGQWPYTAAKPKPKPPHPASYYATFLDRTFTLAGHKLNERTVVERFDRHPTKARQAYLRLLVNRINHVAHFGPHGRAYKHVQWKYGRLHRLRLMLTRIHRKL